MVDQEDIPLLHDESSERYSLADKFQKIQHDLKCQGLPWYSQLHRIAGVTGVNITKTASSLILYQAIVASDFKNDIDYETGWYITAGLLVTAPVILLTRFLYYLFNGTDYNPIRHTDNLIETLEIGAFSYGLLASIVRGFDPEAVNSSLSKAFLLTAALSMIVLRNFDPDVSVWRNQALGHKLPIVFLGRKPQPQPLSADSANEGHLNSTMQWIIKQNKIDNPLFPSVGGSLPTDSKCKRWSRYGFRALQMLIPPTILGDTTFRIITFGTGRTHQQAAAIASGCYALEHLTARLFDVRNTQGKPMRDLKQDPYYRWTRADSIMAAFCLALVQSYYVLGDLAGFFHYLQTGQRDFDSLSDQNLPWTLVVIYGFACLLASYAAYDNANMYEQFFANKDQFATCRQACQDDWEPQESDLETFWLERLQQSHHGRQDTVYHQRFIKDCSKDAIMENEQSDETYKYQKLS